MLQRMQMAACDGAVGQDRRRSARRGARTGARGSTWRARFNAHKETYTAASLGTDDRGKWTLVEGLIDCLDTRGAVDSVPGNERLLAVVEPPGNRLADTHLRGAGKSGMERSTTKKKPAAPTEMTETSAQPIPRAQPDCTWTGPLVQ
jgi:hypothetical protein